jgi:hypothetical protein
VELGTDRFAFLLLGPLLAARPDVQHAVGRRHLDVTFGVDPGELGPNYQVIAFADLLDAEPTLGREIEVEEPSPQVGKIETLLIAPFSLS